MFNERYLRYLGGGGGRYFATNRPRSAGWTNPTWGVHTALKEVGPLVGRILFEGGDHFYIGPTSWFEGPVVSYGTKEIADFYYAFRESRSLSHPLFGVVVGKRTFALNGMVIIGFEDSGQANGFDGCIGAA